MPDTQRSSRIFPMQLCQFPQVPTEGYSAWLSWFVWESGGLRGRKHPLTCLPYRLLAGERLWKCGQAKQKHAPFPTNSGLFLSLKQEGVYPNLPLSPWAEGCGGSVDFTGHCHGQPNMGLAMCQATPASGVVQLSKDPLISRTC